MLDAVLYDIDSRKLLFRAPGRSSVESNSTLVGLEEQTREDAVSGFEQASVSLRDNLKLQLELFRKKVKETPEEYQIVKSEGYRGGGSSYWFMFLLAGAIALSKFRK
jgi:rhombotail lipoprotein